VEALEIAGMSNPSRTCYLSHIIRSFYFIYYCFCLESKVLSPIDICIWNVSAVRVISATGSR